MTRISKRFSRLRKRQKLAWFGLLGSIIVVSGGIVGEYGDPLVGQILFLFGLCIAFPMLVAILKDIKR